MLTDLILRQGYLEHSGPDLTAQKWQVEVNLLCVVTGPAARGQAIYQNLKKLGGGATSVHLFGPMEAGGPSPLRQAILADSCTV